MYLQLFQDIMGFMEITNNLFLDMIILIVTSKIVHAIVYSFVGGLYRENIISGSFAGRVAYFITWIVCLFPSFLILYIIAKLISFINWLL